MRPPVWLTPPHRENTQQAECRNRLITPTPLRPKITKNVEHELRGVR